MASSDYGFYKFKDFLALPYDRDPWLIKPIIPAHGWVNVYGEPKKAKKSYWSLGASWAISNPSVKNWLGFDVHNHGPVLYMQVDTPHDLWVERLREVNDAGYDLSNVFFSSIATLPYPFSLEQHADILNDLVQQGPKDACMMVFDTGRQMHRKDENQSKDMTEIMDTMNAVAGINRAKLLITHGKKGPSEGDKEQQQENEGGDLMKGNRGSSAVAGAVDTVVKLTPKGYMWYQGRAVGESHKRLRFQHLHKPGQCPHGDGYCPAYMWEEDIDPAIAEANHLINTYKNGSTRSLARLLAQKMQDVSEDQAREIIRRQRGERFR